MFTGIVEGTGRIEALSRQGRETRLRVAAPFLTPALERGASIAVDGVCLTAIDSGPGWFAAVVSPETLSRTTLALRAPEERVNLERPLRLGDRLGGHLVQGHVDDVGIVEGVRPEGSGARVRIRFPAELAGLIVMKGSIAVDGVSLTVAARGDRWFEVALIPETLRATRAPDYASGSPVNLEVDMMGRYAIEHLKRQREEAPQEALVTRELLARHGFGRRDEAR